MPSAVSLAKMWNPEGVANAACITPSTSMPESRNVITCGSPPNTEA